MSDDMLTRKDSFPFVWFVADDRKTRLAQKLGNILARTITHALQVALIWVVAYALGARLGGVDDTIVAVLATLLIIGAPPAPGSRPGPTVTPNLPDTTEETP